MIFRVEIENFRSIHQRQVIDLVAAANAPDDGQRLAPLWKGSDKQAPKVVAIFGANASGKSTVLCALSFISWFIQTSAKFGSEQYLRMNYAPFYEDSALHEPTRLCIHFEGWRDPLASPEQRGDDSCHYAYEVVLQLLPDNSASHVISEAVRFWPKDSGRPITILSREKEVVRGSKYLSLGAQGAALSAVLNPSASAISTLAHLRHPQAMEWVEMAGRIISNILDEKGSTTEKQLVEHLARFPHLVPILRDELQRLDVGISDFRIENGSQGPYATLTHHGLTVPLFLHQESHGTRSFLQIFPLLIAALNSGGVAVIDELDLAMHPAALVEVISRFYSKQTNPAEAQLWMTCQNASLLEHLSKEEILFCQKDALGQTSVYGLPDVKSVRRDDNYYRKYLGGEFGAVPRFG